MIVRTNPAYQGKATQKKRSVQKRQTTKNTTSKRGRDKRRNKREKGQGNKIHLEALGKSCKEKTYEGRVITVFGCQLESQAHELYFGAQLNPLFG